jgi:type VI secretion system protein ImpJ
MAALEEALSLGPVQRAISLDVKKRGYGMHSAKVTDSSLIGSSSFVLSVHADIPGDQLRQTLPKQIKIGSVENIRELLSKSLPGIAITPLPVVPRQLPFHAGNVYFELDSASEYWSSLENSAGFGIHIGGDFPGLTIELWAIRG